MLGANQRKGVRLAFAELRVGTPKLEAQIDMKEGFVKDLHARFIYIWGTSQFGFLDTVVEAEVTIRMSCFQPTFYRRMNCPAVDCSAIRAFLLLLPGQTDSNFEKSIYNA